MNWQAEAKRWKGAFWSLYNEGISQEKRDQINKKNKELAQARRKAKKPPKNSLLKNGRATPKKNYKKTPKKRAGEQLAFF